MSYYKNTAANILRQVRSLIRLQYSEFQVMNKAISFLEKDFDEDAETPFFRISMAQKDGSTFYLIFDEEGFKFQEYIYEHDNNLTPIDIRVHYDTGKEDDYSEGQIEDWEAAVESLLSQYKAEEAVNEVSINFTDSY